MFEYDHAVPLDVQYYAAERRGEVIVQRITFRGYTRGNAIGAYLVKPCGDGPFPGLLYVHWYEPKKQSSNPTQFLPEAMMMAQTYGVQSLLVETMWTARDWYEHGRTLAGDYDDAVEQVIDLRRALDVLQAQPTVDPDRIAYVGHDFGAMYGAILAGIDRRAIAYALIAGASDFNQWMLFGVENHDCLDSYKRQMAALAPAHYVAQAAPASLLFQFGTEDFYTPETDYQAFFEAASEPKAMFVYPVDHAMARDNILDDRIAFLVDQLALETRMRILSWA